MTEHIPKRAHEALTREEVLAIFEWTRDKDVSDTFSVVNSALYGNRPENDFTRAFAEILNRALGKLPVLEQTVVFRGAPKSRIPNLEHYQEGATVRLKGFTATSKDAFRAFERQGVDSRFTIIHRSARNLEPLSANGSIKPDPENEREALIPSDRVFAIRHRRDRPESILEIVLEEVSDAR